jgi:protein O-mannosyl-transferase
LPIVASIQNRNLIIAALVLVIMVLAAYHKAFDNNFVDWDDFTYVVNNDLVRNPDKTGITDVFRSPVSSNWHPLTILTMRANGNECNSCQNGISPAPFIRWNIILHILNTLLVLFLVMKLTGGNLFIAFFAAAIFGVHPMHVESVAWISERKDVLYSFFFLSGLITYLKFREEQKVSWLGVTFILFVLSCLSKAVAVVFPLVLLLMDYWFIGKDGGKKISTARELFSYRRLAILAPFLLVSLFTGLMAYRLQDGRNFLAILDQGSVTPDVVNAAGPFTFFEKLRNGSYGFMAYIIKFFAPSGLVAFYPYPGSRELESSLHSTLLTAAPFAMLLILALAVYSVRKTNLYVFGLGFYLLTVVLVLQFIPVGYAIIADRYSYLPYVGIAFIAGHLIFKLKNSRIRWVISGAFILTMIFITIRQADVWQNSETLWTRTIEKFPEAEVARRSRGKFYSKKAIQADSSEKKKYEALAMKDFQAAVSAGSANAEVYEGLGVLLGSGGENTTALRYFDAALKLDNENGSIYYNRALTYGKMERNEDALRDYSQALKYAPEKSIMIRTNRSNLLLEMGRFSEAISDLDYLIARGKADYDLYYNRAVAKQLTRDFAGAITDYRKALSINPNDEQARKQMEDLEKLVN